MNATVAVWAAVPTVNCQRPRGTRMPSRREVTGSDCRPAAMRTVLDAVLR